MTSKLENFKPKSVQLKVGRRVTVDYPSSTPIFGTIELEGKRESVIILDSPFCGEKKVIVKNTDLILI